MIKRYIRAISRRFLRRFEGDPDAFLQRCKGIVHVGANLGQERELYASFDLNVLWIEPIPEVFSRLQKSIATTPKQKAVCALVTDENDREYEFNLSNNDGASSSIFDLSEHRKLWPEVTFTRKITLRSATLSDLLKREQIDLGNYDAMVMDTQGSELLVLKGALSLLKEFRFIKTEVADFESYKGCCQLSEIDKFLVAHGFRRIAKREFAGRVGTGSYFDVLYAAV